MEQENMQAQCPQAEEQQQAAPSASMSETAYPFRSATFGGFQRLDVLNYLKKLQETHAQELLTLQTALDAAHAQAAADRQLVQNCEEAERQAAELHSQLDAARTIAEGKTTALDAVEAEKAALQAELETLRPRAEAYAHLRERTATIEFDAHERAANIELAARGRAEDIETEAKENAVATVVQALQESARVRAEYTEWARDMRAEYQELRKDMNLTFRNATQELERVCGALEQTATEFDIHEEELQSFMEQIELPCLEDTELE